MSIELITKYSDKVDELFSQESKTSLLTNTDYDWSGAHSVKVYKASTVALNDYARTGETEDISRYGKINELSAEVEEMLLKNDKSFIFNLDRMDEEETALQAEECLAREIRDVVVPTVDSYVYKTLVENCGTTATAESLTAKNVYEKILDGGAVLDDNMVPETDRVLIVAPSVYKLLKQSAIFDSTDVGADLRMKGVIGLLDGMNVVKVPSSRLPQNFGFLLTHPVACTAPMKLEDYNIHSDTPLSSGSIITGRIVFDAFVLDNKKMGVYYQPIA